MRGMAMSRRFIGLAVMAAALLALFWVAPAGARELVEFEKEATLATNGPIPPVPAKPGEEAKEVCGSETQVFGSELLSGEQTEPPTPTLNGQAHANLENAYIPHEGDRIAMRGRWIIDCGHNDFHAELHPITFMAFGHAVEKKTVVHVISNPYRVTELYGFGTGEVNSSSPKGTPFPQALEETITSV